MGNGQRGGYTPRIFQPNGGVGKTSPRQVPARAPACLTLYYDGLARRPQLMPSTDTFCFFVGLLLGLTAPWRRRVHKDPPFRPQFGGICPRNSTIWYVVAVYFIILCSAFFY